MKKLSSSRAAILAVVAAVAVVAIALTSYFAFAAPSNQAADDDATDILDITDTAASAVTIDLTGIDSDLLSGAVISIEDVDGKPVLEKKELRGKEDIPSLEDGDYTVSVIAPPVASDGTVYECEEPTYPLTVGGSPSTLDLTFAPISKDAMTPETLEAIRAQLEAAGIAPEVFEAVSQAYTQATPSEASQNAPESASGVQGASEAAPSTTTPQTPSQGAQATTPATNAQSSAPAPTTAACPYGGSHSFVAYDIPTELHHDYTIYDYQMGLTCGTCGGGSYCYDHDHYTGSRHYYDYKNENPPDLSDMFAALKCHQQETGHSGYETYQQRIARTGVPRGCETMLICSKCGKMAAGS